MTNSLPIEIGFPAAGDTGWGLIAVHMALGLARQGRRVHIPASSDLRAVTPALRPTLEAMMAPADGSERRIRIDAYGNHWPGWQEIPNRVRVVFAVFEDTAIPDEAVTTLNRFDLVLAPSQWIHDLLAAKGVRSTVWHQGYDETLFYPAPRRRPDGPVYVFSAGKLEFRKGQDIVIEAFKRFRETPEGKDAVLVTAWQNRWPQTMEGIWASGYVKGIPAMRGSQLDIVGWCEINGLPKGSVIDLGFASQPEIANAIRECDVGLFPNRCEGATNIALVETLGCAIPCVVGPWTGQGDVEDWHAIDARNDTAVTLPCSLYRGVDGWREGSPGECADKLVTALDYRDSSPPVMVGWNWSDRCEALSERLHWIEQCNEANGGHRKAVHV